MTHNESHLEHTYDTLDDAVTQSSHKRQCSTQLIWMDLSAGRNKGGVGSCVVAPAGGALCPAAAAAGVRVSSLPGASCRWGAAELALLLKLAHVPVRFCCQHACSTGHVKLTTAELCKLLTSLLSVYSAIQGL
jgi:hypothetical protein